MATDLHQQYETTMLATITDETQQRFVKKDRVELTRGERLLLLFLMGHMGKVLVQNGRLPQRAWLKLVLKLSRGVTRN